jgi:hypothetical protein
LKEIGIGESESMAYCKVKNKGIWQNLLLNL